VSNKIIIFAFLVALIGFCDATYLSIEHFRGVVPPCSITAGCEKVLTSSYAVVAGIPVSLAGSFYYLVVLIGLLAYLESGNLKILKQTLFLTFLGLLASLGFIYVQVFIIGSYCLYCMGSAITSTILFVTAVGIINSQPHFHE